MRVTDLHPYQDYVPANREMLCECACTSIREGREGIAGDGDIKFHHRNRLLSSSVYLDLESNHYLHKANGMRALTSTDLH